MESQPEPTLVELIRYNNWANAQVLAACRALDPGQLAAAAPGAYGSIRDTLGHIVRGEVHYTSILTGDRPQPPFRWEDQPALDEVSAFANRVAEALLAAVQRTPPAAIVREDVDGQTVSYQARVLFIQAINHGIEHRTNITTILSGLGLPAPEVDGWAYAWAHPQRFEVNENSQ